MAYRHFPNFPRLSMHFSHSLTLWLSLCLSHQSSSQKLISDFKAGLRNLLAQRIFAVGGSEWSGSPCFYANLKLFCWCLENDYTVNNLLLRQFLTTIVRTISIANSTKDNREQKENKQSVRQNKAYWRRQPIMFFEGRTLSPLKIWQLIKC